jgi:hypothetical protein
MVVAISMNTVTYPPKNEGLILKWLKRLQTLLKIEFGSNFIGPERVWNDAIGTKNDDEALLSAPLCLGSKGGKVAKER